MINLQLTVDTTQHGACDESRCTIMGTRGGISISTSSAFLAIKINKFKYLSVNRDYFSTLVEKISGRRIGRHGCTKMRRSVVGVPPIAVGAAQR
jgi:hypothetical protein